MFLFLHLIAFAFQLVALWLQNAKLQASPFHTKSKKQGGGGDERVLSSHASPLLSSSENISQKPSAYSLARTGSLHTVAAGESGKEGNWLF